MIQRLRNSLLLKSLWGLLALFLLNMSVDTADSSPDYIPEDLSFNDQESIVEIVVEQLLGYADAIAEYDEHDTPEHNNKKGNIKLDLAMGQNSKDAPYQGPFAFNTQLYPPLKARLTCGFHQLDTPPPKA